MKNKIRLFWVAIITVSLIYSIYPVITYYFGNDRLMKYGILGVAGLASLLTSFFVINRTCEKWVQIMTKTENAKRNIGMDVVRVLAVSLVILTHYINRRGYYNTPAEGTPFFWLTTVRYLALCCCPLFMILTGFFLYNRKVDKKHYGNLFHWLRNYFFLCIIALLLWNKSYFTVDTVKSLVNFERYWYVNMYFGLFLIAPFLNAMWHSLDAEKKKWLIAILVLLSSFSSVTGGWWTTYWNTLFPLVYYFIGMWLRENELKVKKLPALCILLLTTLIESVFTMYVHPGEIFNWGANYGGYQCGYNAVPIIIKCCIMILLLKDIHLENKIICRILSSISKCSLEIYLFACMYVDNVVYARVQPFWEPKIGPVGMFFILMPLEIAIITIFTTILNKVCDIIQKLFSKGMQSLAPKKPE